MTHFETPLFFRSVVHTSSNDIPATVHVGKVSAPYRTCGSQSQLNFSYKFKAMENKHLKPYQNGSYRY